MSFLLPLEASDTQPETSIIFAKYLFILLTAYSPGPYLIYFIFEWGCLLRFVRY